MVSSSVPDKQPLDGQSPKGISQEMHIGRQWLSVILNSPLFQEEFQRLRQIEDEKLVSHLVKGTIQRLNVPLDKKPPQTASTTVKPSLFYDVENAKHEPKRVGLGEDIIIELSRKQSQGERLITSTSTAAPDINALESTKLQQGRCLSASRERDTTSSNTSLVQVRAAKFYSEVVQDWVWLSSRAQPQNPGAHGKEPRLTPSK